MTDKRHEFTRTAAALDAYDEHDAKVDQLADMTNAQAGAWLSKSGRLAAAVGEAFALDTADVNPSDVAFLIRPCRKGNPGGKSFVRKCVDDWRADYAEDATR